MGLTGAWQEASLAAITAVGLEARLLRGRTLILGYRRIRADETDSPFRSCNPYRLTLSQLRSQLRYLQKYFQIGHFADLAQPASKSSSKAGRILICFDEGWIEHYQLVFPLLQELGIPATFFVPTGYIGQQRAFWWLVIEHTVQAAHKSEKVRQQLQGLMNVFELEAGLQRLLLQAVDRTPEDWAPLLDQLRGLPADLLQEFCDACHRHCGLDMPVLTLNWSQIREMSAAGLWFAPLSVTLAHLPALSRQQAQWEVQTSLGHLKDRDGINVTNVFAYPFGAFNHEIQYLMRHSGLQYAVTSSPGTFSLHQQERFALPRLMISAENGQDLSLFRRALAQACRQP